MKVPGRPPSNSPELRRVMGVPRRTPELPPLEDCEALSRDLRLPGSTFVLRPVQVLALLEAWQVGGLFAMLGLGAGKTALSFLLPRIWGAKAPLLLLPAGLIGKSQIELAALERDFGPTPGLRLSSYHAISNDPGLLERLAPDAILADEADALKDTESGVTRRWVRYMEAHPECYFAALSATFANSSVTEYMHLLAWSLKEHTCALLDWRETASLASATDRKSQQPTGPGALLHWATPEQRARAELSFDEGRDVAREIWAQRLEDTRGVVRSFTVSTQAELAVRAVRTPGKPPQGVVQALATLEDAWTLPSGDMVTDHLSLRTAALQLALGFQYVPIVPPPAEWRLARREWAGAVRYSIHKLRRQLDTEGEVVKALDELPGFVREAWDAWELAQQTYDYQTRPELLEPDAPWFLVDLVHEWLERHPAGLVWCQHTFVAEQLSARLGVPFYGPGALHKATKRPLKAHPPGLPALLSLSACQKGQNLQAHRANLFLCPPTDQAIGRTHRAGQEQPVVVDVLCDFAVQRRALQSAQEGARYGRKTLRTPSGFAEATIDWDPHE